jgi:hypothetical protein
MKYYISTGLFNNYYTLRYTTVERGARSVGYGLPPEITTITRDYHIRNLSTDRAEALRKAREFTGSDLAADFDVVPIGERRDFEGDWSIFRAGKYEGLSIHEVLETDRDYVLFMLENNVTSPRYAKTLDLARALLGDELDARAKAKAAAARRAEIRKTRRIHLLASSAGILREYYATGSFAHNIASTLEEGSLPVGRGYSITLDMIARTNGRRNSKEYTSRYDHHARRFALADRLAAA